MTYGFGSGTPDPLVLNDGTFTTIDINGGTIDATVIGGSSAAAGSFTTINASGKLTVDGGAKVSVQNKVDGTSDYGIFLYDTDDTSWGVYMSQSGGTRSLANTAACTSIDGRSGFHFRSRVAGGSTFGFLWENAADVCLMSLAADTGALHTAGVINAGGAVVVESYTVATVPSASGVGAGGHIFVTDETGGATGAYSDGTNWRRYSDRAIVS